MAFAARSGIDVDMVPPRVDAFQNIGDTLFHAFGSDAVFGVVGHLAGAAAVGLANGVIQAFGHGVGVKNYPAIDVAGRAPDGLDQGPLGSGSLPVGVQNGDQRAFRNIESLAEQVDADKTVERAEVSSRE